MGKLKISDLAKAWALRELARKERESRIDHLILVGHGYGMKQYLRENPPPEGVRVTFVYGTDNQAANMLLAVSSGSRCKIAVFAKEGMSERLSHYLDVLKERKALIEWA